MMKSGTSNVGAGMGAGIAIGVALGVALDNLALGIALGGAGVWVQLSEDTTRIERRLSRCPRSSACRCWSTTKPR